jgi:hypothetical protein
LVVTVASPVRHLACRIGKTLARIALAVIGLLPVCAAAPPGGNMASPLGSPDPSMSLTAGSPSPIMTFVFTGIGSGQGGANALQMPDSTAAGPAAMSGADPTPSTAGGEVGATPRLGNSGAVRAIIAPPDAQRRDAPACYDDYAAHQLQNGGAFWTPQARSAGPVQFPAAVFTGNRPGSRDPVTLGPSGHPVNLPAEGPAGPWCRPPPVPMSQTSPLASRTFWVVLLFPMGVFVVFWLSRGLRIKAVHEA